eukprot:gene3039-8368_t
MFQAAVAEFNKRSVFSAVELSPSYNYKKPTEADWAWIDGAGVNSGNHTDFRSRVRWLFDFFGVPYGLESDGSHKLSEYLEVFYLPKFDNQGMALTRGTNEDHFPPTVFLRES